MENPEKFNAKDALRKKPTAKRTLFLIALTVIVLGAGVTFYFTNRIENFFLQARTSFVGGVVHELAIHYLQNDDITNWQKQDAGSRLALFAKEAKEYIPSTAAIKIYTADGTLAWTDLQGEKPGYKEPGIEIEIKDVADAGQLVKSASVSTEQELGKTNLLEVWSTVKNAQKESLGYIEIYFDTSDIAVFITEIKYSIWFVVITMLSIVLFMISLAFRKQDDLIVRQAHELSNIIDQSPIGIYTVSKNGVIESCNPAMMKISGSTGACEVVGGNIFDTEEYIKNGLSELMRAGLEGTTFETEVAFESPKNLNQKTFRRYHGVPIRNGAGAVLYLLVMVEDITEHRKKEQSLGAQAQELETAVDARTKALEDKIAELERFERLTVDREIRMTELKQQIEKMRIKLEGLGVDAGTL